MLCANVPIVEDQGDPKGERERDKLQEDRDDIHAVAAGDHTSSAEKGASSSSSLLASAG